MVSQRRQSTLRFNARLRTMTHSVFRSSVVLLSRPSQTPSSRADSNLKTRAPGRLHAAASPTSKIVVVESCRLWNRVYCHAACRGNQVGRGTSTWMVLPEFFSIWIL